MHPLLHCRLCQRAPRWLLPKQKPLLPVRLPPWRWSRVQQGPPLLLLLLLLPLLLPLLLRQAVAALGLVVGLK